MSKYLATPKTPLTSSDDLLSQAEPRYDEYILNIRRHASERLDSLYRAERTILEKRRTGVTSKANAGFILWKIGRARGNSWEITVGARAAERFHDVVRVSRPVGQSFAVCSCGLMVPTEISNLAQGEVRDFSNSRWDADQDEQYPGFLEALGHGWARTDAEPSDYWHALQEGGAFDE